MPEGLVLSPDGTGFLSLGAQEPAAPQVGQQNNTVSSPAATPQNWELEQRRALGLEPTPAAGESAAPVQPMSLEELVQKGYLDPKAPQNVTLLASYNQAISKVQAEAGRYRAQLEAVAQQQRELHQQAQRQQRDAELQQRLAEAAPHERLRIQREHLEQESLVREREVASQKEYLEDVVELGRWQEKWVREDQIDPRVFAVADAVADRIGARDPAQRYEIYQRARLKFMEDRARGIVPTPNRQPTTPANAGTPYTPVVAPAGTPTGTLNINQQLADALRSQGEDNEGEKWRAIYRSLGMNPIG